MTNNAILDPQMLFIKNLYFSISILEKCILSSFNKLFTYHPPINPPKITTENTFITQSPLIILETPPNAIIELADNGTIVITYNIFVNFLHFLHVFI